MTNSMTGFAALKGHHGIYSWTWDIRSVNARGLDVRLRLPDWVDGLEAPVRKAVTGAVTRGNVSVALRVQRDSEEGGQVLNSAALERVLSMLIEVNHAAEVRGLALTTATAADVAVMRGVIESASVQEDTAPLLKALTAQLPDLLAAFNQMRAREGTAMAEVLNSQIDQIEALTTQATAAIEDRTEAQADGLRTALARVMDNTDGADPDRVAQELALIAVKTDVREEIDRLHAHVTAARELMAVEEAKGRKLDFLMQEFNREANTLCSKAQFNELTRIGLDLKAVIDQMREQVQNVE